MHFANSLTALTILGVVAQVQAKAVFAHFMVGNISAFSIVFMYFIYFIILYINADTV